MRETHPGVDILSSGPPPFLEPGVGDGHVGGGAQQLLEEVRGEAGGVEAATDLLRVSQHPLLPSPLPPPQLPAAARLACAAPASRRCA
eukprot:10183123-Alexandrium_andersonii.AAC.1